MAPDKAITKDEQNIITRGHMGEEITMHRWIVNQK